MTKDRVARWPRHPHAQDALHLVGLLAAIGWFRTVSLWLALAYVVALAFIGAPLPSLQRRHGRRTGDA